MTERARTVFLGTGAFAVPIVSALSEHPSIDLVAVVTAPSRPVSRGRVVDPPVAVWAAEHGIDALRPVRLRAPEAVAEILALEPELLVLADYGQIVPSALLDMPRHGALNVHPSLLPRHRGATPIPAAILAGDAETGVTLMRMDAGLDTGPVVAQWRHALSGGETAPELESALAVHGAELLTATLEPWLDGRIEPIEQDEQQQTLTKPFRRADGRLDPRRSATDLERHVRAFQPWPGTFFDTDSGRVVIWRASVDGPRSSFALGELVRGAEGDLAVAADDALLELIEVQPAGGKRMSGAELVRGRPGLVGQRVAAPADQGA